MHTENETKKAQNILSEMALFMSDTKQIADVGEQSDDLETLLRAFLVGDFANEQNLRNSILVITDQLQELYKLLAKFSSEDVNDALRLIVELKPQRHV